jgi:hypothetical protein
MPPAGSRGLPSPCLRGRAAGAASDPAIETPQAVTGLARFMAEATIA